MKKVSVIVPVYNVEQYLRDSLESLVHQTLEDIEICCINDGSPDHSQEIIDEYVIKYPDKVKSFIKENGGVASVRNYGLQVATGEYIGYLDGDDYAELTLFEKLYNSAKLNDSDIAVCGFYFTYPDHQEERYEPHYSNSKEMMVGLHAVLWNKIFKSSVVKSAGISFPEGKRYEDACYLYKLCPFINSISFVDECLIHYVQHENSYMSSHNHRVKDVVDVENEIIRFFKEHNWFEKFHQELEYISVKFSLGQPFRSAVKIGDKKDRKYTLDLMYKTLNEQFPTWHENIYLKGGLKNMYFKSVNKMTYPIYSFVFKHIHFSK